MFQKFWEIIRQKEDLLEQSKKETLAMLNTSKEMFGMVLNAIKEEVDEDIRRTIGKIDVQINDHQREVRRMVYHHLVISSSADLLTGLQLLNIVIDIERIGDYTKNLADLVEMLPGKILLEEYEEEFTRLEKSTMKAFDLTIKGLEEDDVTAAEQVVQLYDDVGKKCNSELKDIITSKAASQEMVEKRYLAMVLLLRYLKRVNAHLKNVATNITNPFHKVGYRPS